MKNKTLLVMAAGMGSRFGGLKQIEPVGPNGEFIIDYSVYDAIKAGFNKVVFIIKEENLDIFKETIGSRLENKIKVEYVFQKNEDLPLGYTYPNERTKPWGTSHAILAAKDFVNENFVVINSDDFYGADAYVKASEFLDSIKEDAKEYALIGYEVGNTILDDKEVKRGICMHQNDIVENIIESKVVRKDNKIIATPLNEDYTFEINEEQVVSMNMFCFTKEIFKYLEENFKKFLDENKENILTCEYLIPDSIAKCISEKKAVLKYIKTNAKWFGITYKEDKEKLVNEINNLIEKQILPKKLF